MTIRIALGAAMEHAARSASDELWITISSLVASAIVMGDVICKSLLQWGVNLMSLIFFKAMVFLNPKLRAGQQSQLLHVLSRAMENFVQRGSLDEQLMRSIVTLVSPDRGTCLLLTYLIEAFTAGFVRGGEGSTRAANPDEERRVALALIKQYGIHRAPVAAMPPEARRAILKSLGGARTGSSRGNSSSPICCITLEPLLWPDSTVTEDVLAVIQRSQHRDGDEHAFLYRGSALLDWLGRREVPMSPETRSIITPSDIYRLS